MNKDYIREQLIALERNKPTKAFKLGLDKVTTGGAILGIEEKLSLLEVVFDMWLTSGKKTSSVEKKLGLYLGTKYNTLTTSGSSANLLAFYALTSESLGDRRILPGDEVITVACSFPTTIAPIIQYGAIPVFVDVTIPEYNIDIQLLNNALTPKTKAIMVAHTLGNPFNLEVITKFCEDNNLWLIEDCADALGSTYDNQKVGSFGDIATFSFFPAHQITAGEGGLVVTNNPKLYRIISSLISWGKACWCLPGQDNCCGQRHCMKQGDLPLGYDHKYTFTHFGFNLKATEMQAAILDAQIDKIEVFNEIRKRNFSYYTDNLSKYSDYIVLPSHLKQSDPSWFGFLITIKLESPVKRQEFVKRLEDAGIQTRMLFAGNLIKQPAFSSMVKSKKGFRVIGSLENTNRIMNNSFWIGVHQGITQEMTEYVCKVIGDILC